jgi:uncharacterized protein (TIGR02246 family)
MAGTGMKCLLLLVVLPVLWTAGQAAGQPSETAAVTALVDRYAAARETEDAASLETLFTSDADQLVSSGEWRRGRAALVKGMMGSSRANPGDRTITVEEVRFLRDDVAIANARYEIGASANREARQMWSSFVCVKQNGRWQIAAIRNMLPAR